MSISSSVCDHVHDVQQLTSHDVSERLIAAEEQCRIRGVRFTPLRQQIYALILQADKPVGAYDLITQLQQTRLAELEHAESIKIVVQKKRRKKMSRRRRFIAA